MKLKEVKLKNYKGIKELAFFPKETTALIGPNGSGKSTVLQLIKSLFNGDELTVDRPFEFDIVIEVTSSLVSREAMASLDKTLSHTFVVLEDKTLNIFGATDKGVFKEFTKIAPYLHALTEGSPLILIDNFDKTRKTQDNVSKINLNMSRSLMDTLLSSIRRRSETMTLAELELTWMVELTRMGCTMYPKYSYGENRLIFPRNLKLKDLSKGEQFLTTLTIMLTTLPTTGGILLIDEPETAMHPKWRTQIIEWVHRLSNTQVIIATHDPLILQGLHGSDIVEMHRGCALNAEYSSLEELLAYTYEVLPNPSPAKLELDLIHNDIIQQKILDLEELRLRVDTIRQANIASPGIGIYADFLEAMLCG